MDVVPPPAVEPAAPAPSETPGPETTLGEPAEHPLPPKSKSAQSNNKSVTTAIIATVVIVLGLAALAVAAFLKQK